MLAQVEGVGQAGRGALNSAYQPCSARYPPHRAPGRVSGLGVIPRWEESAMPQDTTGLIEVLLLIFGVGIAGFAIGGAVQAWRSWSDHRRIERHLGRR